MNTTLKITALAFAFVSSVSAFALQSGNTRVTYPSAVSVEVLGRGMLGSVNFDQVVSDELAAGFGLGTTGTQIPVLNVDAGVNATTLPVYVNYYFMPEAGSLYATVGADVILNNSSVKGLNSSLGSVPLGTSGILPTFGLGYERRTDTGFLFRMAAYGIVGSSIKPWFGGTFGMCF